MSDVPTIRCPVCGVGLKVITSVGKRGKASLSLICPRDPRDFRAFIHDQAFVRRVLDSLDGQTPSSERPDDVDDNPRRDNPSKRILERPNG